MSKILFSLIMTMGISSVAMAGHGGKRYRVKHHHYHHHLRYHHHGHH